MDIKEIKEYLEANKESEEVQDYIKGFEKPLTLNGVSEFINTDEDAKKWMQSSKDSYFTKGIETWKQNNLETLIDGEVKKRFPDKDPKDIELEKLRFEIQGIKKGSVLKELKSEAYKLASEKKLPLKLVDFFIADDVEKTTGNISMLETEFANAVKAAVEERFKQGGRDPQGGQGGGFSGVNPWKSESFNLTLQGKMLKENPELAKSLMANK